MNPRGTYGPSRGGSPRKLIGGPLFHTVGDRDRVVEQVDTEFTQLISELYRKMGGDPDLLKIAEAKRDPVGWSKRYKATEQTISTSPLYPLWKDTVMPVWNEWKSFYNEQSSWEEWKTDWDTYENWSKRIQNMHAHVASEVQRILGQQIRTPAPADAPKTVWAEAGEAGAGAFRAIGGGVGDVWQILKFAAYAGVAVGGVYVVTKLVQTSRSSHRR